MTAVLPVSLVLTPVSRRPTTLPDETAATILAFDVDTSPEPTVVDPSSNSARPQLSIVVVTRNNVVFLKLCVSSILVNTRELSYEIIVVDNNSTDGTAEYLASLARSHPRVRVVSNGDNLGFAKGNNQGLAIAAGDAFVLLNDDTIVPPGSLERLCHHVADPTVGLVGPVTNRCGNESQIDVACHTYGDLLELARQRLDLHAGELRDLPMLTMFALAMRREVHELVGPLDELFAIGMFEDDDYAVRTRLAGYRLVCADDVFVYHFGATSLGKLAVEGRFGPLFETNRARFETKWGRAWTPHRRRVSPDYALLMDHLREVVVQAVEPASVVAVVSRGDEGLLDLPGRIGWHFPQRADGTYLGYNPASSDDAIAWLESARDRGARYLLIPRTARWWLDYYREFDRHLRARHRVLVEDEDCVLFDLGLE
jgi:GT2 family glycosyltransferase